MRKIFLFILIALLLTGCGTKEEPSDTKEPTDIPKQENTEKENKQDDLIKEPSGYSFEYNNVSIYMNTDVAPVIEALGEAMHYFEAESCAFKGLDKFYTYPGFEITTYPLDGHDYISAVTLMDDSVETPEGIYLGSTVDDMIAAYGDNYEEASGAYTYTKDDSRLQFITMNDEIISIVYLANVEGLE
ncbi:MAG: lipoprotein [Clostridiales bacterium]|nr:lipoprotein [Clostridiales bacterium]